MRQSATHGCAVGLLVTAMTLAGCQSDPPREAPILKPSDGFVLFTNEPRVAFEPGGERFASRVAGHLDAAIARVEEQHGRRFPRPVKVHVFATPRSFGIESPSPHAIGVTVGDRLFLSPRLAASPQRIEGILTHELAHLHFIQHLGAERAYQVLPRWFAEGFAVLVSGSGADRVSEAEAVEAIVAGDHLQLLPTGEALFAEQRDPRGAPPQMFYRQSAMFVDFLRSHYGEVAFQELLNRLFGGEEFDTAFWSSFGRHAPTAWAEFVASIQDKQQQKTP